MNRSNEAARESLHADPAGLPFAAPIRSTATASAVSWAAILAGAAGAAALSLILLVLGVGLGMATMSPWAPSTIGATALGASSIVWLAVTSILASALGGYLAGRLRTRWSDTPADEVYFRDTAHGFLTWALATLLTAGLLTSVVASIVGGGIQAGASVVGGAASAAVEGAASLPRDSDTSPLAYFSDMLFRRDTQTPSAFGPDPLTSAGSPAEDAREVAAIFLQSREAATLPAADLSHLGLMVARRTGLNTQAAEARVTETVARARAAAQAVEDGVKQAADEVRRATAYGSLWLFIALLAGAFFASLAATFGGRQRDS